MPQNTVMAKKTNACGKVSPSSLPITHSSVVSCGIPNRKKLDLQLLLQLASQRHAVKASTDTKAAGLLVNSTGELDSLGKKCR